MPLKPGILKFDVSNVESDMKSLVMAANLDLPDSARRFVSEVVFEKLVKLSNAKLDDVEMKAIVEDIRAMDFDVPIEIGPADEVDE